MGYEIGQQITFTDFPQPGKPIRLTGEIVAVGDPDNSGKVPVQVKVGDTMYHLRLEKKRDEDEYTK